MNTNKHIHTKHISTVNLVGDSEHRHFLELQAQYGFAQRGGVQFPYADESHLKRLVNSINILSSNENRQLVFSELILSN